MPLGDAFTEKRSGKQISDYARQQGEKREAEGNCLRERPMLTMSKSLFHTELDFSMSKILLLCWITETGSQLRPQSSLIKSVVFFCHS